MLFAFFACERQACRLISLLSNLENFEVKNEPILKYLDGSEEKRLLNDCLNKYLSECSDVPCIIDGSEVKTNLIRYQHCPFEKSKKVAQYYWATTVR